MRLQSVGLFRLQGFILSNNIIVLKPDNDERRLALFKDNKLRLLLKLLGFQRLGADDDVEASWIIPASLTASDLKENLDLISKFEFEPPTYEDGKSAEDFIRSKTSTTQRRTAFDDDESGSSSGGEGEFEPGGPTTRKPDALEQLKKSRRKRNRRELEDEEKQRRAEARAKADEERRAKVKSTLFVHDSDDESDNERDQEFFAQEKLRRDAARANILKAITAAQLNEGPAPAKKRKIVDGAKKTKKRRKTDESQENTADEEDEPQPSSQALSTDSENEPDMDSGDDGDETDTPLSSQPQRGSKSDDDRPHKAGKSSIATSAALDAKMGGVDSDDEDQIPIRTTQRRTVRGGFVVESDSDE